MTSSSEVMPEMHKSSDFFSILPSNLFSSNPKILPVSHVWAHCGAKTESVHYECFEIAVAGVYTYRYLGSRIPVLITI